MADKDNFDAAVVFPGGVFSETDRHSNCDFNLVLKNGEVYFGIFFTINNLKLLLEKEEFDGVFWSEELVILREITPVYIERAILQLLHENMHHKILTRTIDNKDIFETYPYLEETAVFIHIPNEKALL
ncbi:MAG: hypothetical protein AAGG75_27870 [Bacteroidota bacterium]